MKSYTPTIESLKNKAPRELNAIFRKAASEAFNPAEAEATQEAARKTMATVLRCLTLQKPLG